MKKIIGALVVLVMGMMVASCNKPDPEDSTHGKGKTPNGTITDDNSEIIKGAENTLSL